MNTNIKASSGFGILGVGRSLPDEVRDNTWWPTSFREQFEAKRGGDMSTPSVLLDRAKTPEQRIQMEEMLETYNDPFRGSRQRRIAPPGAKASTYEIEASQRAIAMAGIDPALIDVVVVASFPADEFSPGNAAIVQKAIGAPNATSLTVDAACASFLAAVNVADAMLAAGRGRYALVCASALYSRLCDWGDPNSVGFGDGAGAVLIGPTGPELGFLAHASRTDGALHQGACCAPKTEGAWFETRDPLVMRSRDVVAGQGVVMNSGGYAKDAAVTVLAKAGLTSADVNAFYAHQPAEWFNRACKRAAGLDAAKTTDTFKQYASVAAANVPINLSHAVEAGQLQRGDTVLLWAFGMGFCWYSSVLRWAR
jgi:3-oxoacyl-[acyl-carrier-protein] synthase III